ncbi:NADP-dependent oxidoreductase domain-containing protein [Xylariales sp. PMI_506]|nr:NADP-dependent oxidoreductase domain-containing protein [Xylariales sp. PMI_506]
MAPTLVFGAGGIGDTEKSFTYTFTTPETVSELLETLKASSVLELDSAASYPPRGPWRTETLLGQSHATDKGFIIDSKVESHAGRKLDEETIPKSLKKTLELLGTDKIRVLYAHGPDPTTPIEQTIKGFVSVVEAGMAEGWGICNYSPAQLRELLACCEEKGYRKPVVVQDLYNLLSREMEDDIIPLCREHGIRFYAYSPLAGGFLTGKVTFASEDGKDLERTRWTGDSSYPFYIEKYVTPAMHDAIRVLHDAGSKEGVSVTEIGLRWLMYHSALRDGDGIILGGKRLAQIESNVREARNGPLSADLLAATEKLKAVQVTSEL